MFLTKEAYTRRDRNLEIMKKSIQAGQGITMPENKVILTYYDDEAVEEDVIPPAPKFDTHGGYQPPKWTMEHYDFEDEVRKSGILNSPSNMPVRERRRPKPVKTSPWKGNVKTPVKTYRAVLRLLTPPPLKANVRETLGHLDNVKQEYKMSTYEYIHLLAQVGFESRFNAYSKERFSYSGKRMRSVFGKHGKRIKLYKNPSHYARHPENLANYVYANRMGNGPESSGDGWRYRGRGLIQITGRDNYGEMTRLYNKRYGTNEDFVRNPESIVSPLVSSRIVFLFWNLKNITERIQEAMDKRKDDGSICTIITRIVNGGYHGLKQRKRYFAHFKRELLR